MLCCQFDPCTQTLISCPFHEKYPNHPVLQCYDPQCLLTIAWSIWDEPQEAHFPPPTRHFACKDLPHQQILKNPNVKVHYLITLMRTCCPLKHQLQTEPVQWLNEVCMFEQCYVLYTGIILIRNIVHTTKIVVYIVKISHWPDKMYTGQQAITIHTLCCKQWRFA